MSGRGNMEVPGKQHGSSALEANFTDIMKKNLEERPKKLEVENHPLEHSDILFRISNW